MLASSEIVVSFLPEKTDPEILVPEWAEFMKGCVRYRQSLDEQFAGKREEQS